MPSLVSEEKLQEISSEVEESIKRMDWEEAFEIEPATPNKELEKELAICISVGEKSNS
ncbi:hypothetical protein [Bythopirellula goksoeyrii]|uniref:Uncharacterized protein n=1 Tax=Bythopirellula goksoeyrii TaxID=1400387 RepID=A0A5B9QBZ6_9BACT|nr:hypothetical protein [Bythopirellula goksoeyrii]QEG34436.1 hypothetical protein Pr1d_17150 [Bythopirellula goksoeyrii]